MAQLLIVDDDPVARLLLRHMLERLDHNVVDADSVDNALAKMSETTFDMIVCDYLMPVRNGLDLLEEHVSISTRRLPFILLTGELRRDDLDDERVAGVNAYLTKPVSSNELSRVVSEQLQGTMGEWEMPEQPIR